MAKDCRQNPFKTHDSIKEREKKPDEGGTEGHRLGGENFTRIFTSRNCRSTGEKRDAGRGMPERGEGDKHEPLIKGKGCSFITREAFLCEGVHRRGGTKI